MRILLGRYGKFYRFLSVDSAERDGSLNLSVHQIRQTHRITLHQSGRINFKGTGASIYIEPLVTMTKPFGFYRYRVPEVSALHEFKSKPATDDAVLELKERDEPCSFVFVISPTGVLPIFTGSVSLTYVDRYVLTVVVERERWVVDAGHEKDFICEWPTTGLFPQQQIAEDEALLKFHQVKSKTHGAVLYEPNGAGEWMLVFSAKRIAPRVDIELVDPTLHVTDQDIRRDPRSERVMMKFKVRRRRTQQIVNLTVSLNTWHYPHIFIRCKRSDGGERTV